jgi:hypothetical protein
MGIIEDSHANILANFSCLPNFSLFLDIRNNWKTVNITPIIIKIGLKITRGFIPPWPTPPSKKR